MARKDPNRTCPFCGHSLTLKPKEFLAIRVELHLTQRQMGERLGVKASHIAYLENGRRHPSMDLMAKFLKLQAEGKKESVKAAKRLLKQAA